jgi:enoyl-CoA hydratase/carnithine racemase
VLSRGHGHRLVSFLKGITMGGGYGLTSQNDLRISTPDSIFAMPENKLGLFPDVGAVSSLAACPDNFGKYLALTGDTIKGPQMLQYGIADVLLSSQEDCDQLEKGMCAADPHILHKLGIWSKIR